MADEEGRKILDSLVNALFALKNAARSGSMTCRELQEMFTELFGSIPGSAMGTTAKGARIEECVVNFMSKLEARREHRQYDGLLTGLRDFDLASGSGIYPGLSVLAQSNSSPDPNMGEHEFAAGIAVRVAKQGNKVVYASTYLSQAKKLASYRDSLGITKDFLCIKYSPAVYFENVEDEIKAGPALVVVDDGTNLSFKSRSLNKLSCKSGVPVFAVARCEKIKGKFYLPQEFELNAANIYRFRKFNKKNDRLDAVRVSVARQRHGPKRLALWFVHFPGTYRFEGLSGQRPKESGYQAED